MHELIERKILLTRKNILLSFLLMNDLTFLRVFCERMSCQHAVTGTWQKLSPAGAFHANRLGTLNNRWWLKLYGPNQLMIHPSVAASTDAQIF